MKTMEHVGVECDGSKIAHEYVTLSQWEALTIEAKEVRRKRAARDAARARQRHVHVVAMAKEGDRVVERLVDSYDVSAYGF